MGTYCVPRSSTLDVLLLPQKGWDTDPCLSIIKRLNETCDVCYSQFRSCSLLSPTDSFSCDSLTCQCMMIFETWCISAFCLDFIEFLDNWQIWYSFRSPTRPSFAITGENSLMNIAPDHVNFYHAGVYRYILGGIHINWLHSIPISKD